MKKFFLIFTIMLMTLVVGCGSNTTENSNIEAIGEQTSNNEQVENYGKVTDREGKEVTLPEKTDKIISLAPSITETLINLGLGDKLVAVDKYSLEVLEEKGINDLPIFDIMTPDAENIVALQPDIIFGTGMSKSDGTDPFAPMVEMGAFVTVIPTSTSIEGIKEDILYIGKVTKTEKEAQKIVEDYQNQINYILSKVEKVKKDKPITVYFETSPMPNAYTFGQDTFLNDMINLLGGENIFSDQSGWLPVSEEQVVAKNPDIILTNATFLETPAEDIKNRKGWENINAIKNDNVFIIDKDSSSRANENSIVAFQEIAEALYLGLFEN